MLTLTVSLVVAVHCRPARIYAGSYLLARKLTSYLPRVITDVDVFRQAQDEREVPQLTAQSGRKPHHANIVKKLTHYQLHPIRNHIHKQQSRREAAKALVGKLASIAID